MLHEVDEAVGLRRRRTSLEAKDSLNSSSETFHFMSNSTARMNFKRVAIIGGGGRMGCWFSKFFVREGFKVIVSGRTRSKLVQLKNELPSIEIAEDNVEAVKNADLIVISVPPQNFGAVVEQIGSHLKAGQAVIDLTSLKEGPVRLMHRFIRSCVTLGAHPMFGPSAADCCQNFILTPATEREKEFAVGFKRWLEMRGFQVSIMSPREHDKLMGTILGLSHFIGLVTFDTWLGSGLRELKKTGGTSFKLLFSLIDNVVHSDPNLYAEIQMGLDSTEEAEAMFERNVRKWLAMVAKKDRQRFVAEMVRLRETFDSQGYD
ncbi:MAG: prephenate dehydrogenase/arogenate dehydrogenase family protein [Nitrososphaeria archaeon]